ncbi:MAG: ATP-binding protein [Bacillaceae bacterium]|nr:ATP-binding protein [Bacillaceae bacterium]
MVRELDLKQMFEIGYSTKSISDDRGYGLAIIQDITTSYHGTLDIKITNNLVKVEISFPKGS